MTFGRIHTEEPSDETGQGSGPRPGGRPLHIREFRMGRFNGQGVCTWPAGARYEGEWRDNLPHGPGIATFPDGTRYEGVFVYGVAHGQGFRITVEDEDEGEPPCVCRIMWR